MLSFNGNITLSIFHVPVVDGKVHPSGLVQQGGDEASLVTAYAALRPRGGFSHPHQEHMIDTFSCIFYFI